MKRVLLFSHEFPPYVGGVGTVGFQLATQLSRAGHDVTVMTRVQAGRAEISGVNFVDVPVLPKLWFRSYHRALKTLTLSEYDLIILNEAAPTIVAGRYFTPTELSRCVVLIHGLEVESLYVASLNNLPRRLMGLHRDHQRACTFARQVFAASRAMHEKFRAAAGDVGREINIMYMGVDPDRFYPEGSDYRTARQVPAGAFLLATGSRVTEAKGFAVMYREFSRLVADGHDVYWAIAGDGDMLGMLKDSAKQDGLDPRIRFEGACDAAGLRRIYNAADLFWLLSEYEEAFGLAYVEAQMTGLASLGRRRGGVAEAIQENVTGYLVNTPEEAYERLRELVSRTRKLPPRDGIILGAARFSTKVTIEPLLDLLVA